MQEKSNHLIFLFLLFLCVTSCEDVFEDDITNENIQLISPIDDAIVLGNTVNFSWQSIEGADNYRIQLFENTQTIVLDSLINNASFTYTLEPGEYQWRVRGENFAYQTAYTLQSNFSVEVSEDLSNQTVVLETPTVDLYSNLNTFIFTWQDLQAANSYDFKLIKSTNTGEQTVFQQQDVLQNSMTIDASVFSDDAEYIWSVKAINTISETNVSQRSLFLDRVSPNQPALVSPNDIGSVSLGTVSFNWSNGSDSGVIQSSITNTIEIATDSNFNSIIITTETINNTSQYNFTVAGTYYWRVKATDLAGNQSDYSITRSLIVQ